MKQHREATTLVGIFLLALLVRVLLLWSAMAAEHELIWDEPSYYGLAVSLVETGRLELDGFRAFRMPFFPLVLASIYYVLGPDPHVAQPFMVVLSALTCAGTYILGRDLFNRRVGLIAGVLISFNSALIGYSRLLMTETLSVFLVLCAMIALERLRKNGRWTWAVAAGMFLGLATLTRANFGPFVPLAAGWVLFNGRAHLRLGLRNATIIVVLAGSLWLGWVARNYSAFNAFVPFTTQGGSGYYGLYNDVAAAQEGIKYGFWVFFPSSSLPGPPDKVWTELELDRLQRNLASAWIRAHPRQAAEIALMQAVHFWRPGIFVPAYLLFVLASLIGFIQSIRQRTQGVILWALLAGAMTVMAVMSVAVQRYRQPLYPIMAVLAGVALVAGWQRIAATRMRATQQGKDATC